jgi:hypothetical protein
MILNTSSIRCTHLDVLTRASRAVLRRDILCDKNDGLHLGDR